jgi:hypothetical protein
MYGAVMGLLLGGMRGWGATWGWLSSGDSTELSSTPFASPLEGSGAFKQAWALSVSRCDSARRVAAYLDEVLALGLGHQRLQLRRREGVDQAGF